MQVIDRFLKYVQCYTTSDPESTAAPSSQNQWDLAEILKEEMFSLGIQDVKLSEFGVLTGRIPASAGLEDKPVLGFVAHMDTSPDFSGKDVHPCIHPNYDGKALQLGESGRVLSPEQFPELPALAGQTLITSDGNTLLGADDKAGVAEIMSACEDILTQNLPHGEIRVAFTPDEEVGRGVEHFDVPAFGADFAYTIDGGPETEISFENFNAAMAEIHVNGFSVHPGDSKDTMINAALVLCELNGMLPSGDTPRNTVGYEGFFHLLGIKGDVCSAEAAYIIRDHDKGLFEGRKKTLLHIADLLNAKYGTGTVDITLRDQYPNMRQIIEQHPFLIEYADKAVESIGLTPCHIPVRGGTDGASLSYMGLPCPNLGTGGYAFHGPYEHITAESLENVRRIALALVKLFAEK